ncbi:glycosyltransferase family 39 protein [Isoptericola hypogeus]|uniref:Glycosyltransferase family 39 protein n=1 Tax=Isoptericola hypogeus TaxID=300179 RepID=A0ABN2IXX7_9MICO
MTAGRTTAGRTLPAVAWLPVGAVAVALAAVLTATSGRYGYHRDELYFRMLDPAWGYVDQPPLTPGLARAFTRMLGDTVEAMRVPATLSLVGAVLLAALLARELGGRGGAQVLAAGAFGTAATPLIFGHTFLTASLDLVVWGGVLWCVARALLADHRFWVVAGAVAGVGMYNKLLVGALLGALAVGILVAGPRRALATPWPWAGAATAQVVGLPQLLYQAGHGWPQLAMGEALRAANAADVRVDMWLFQLLTLGPPLAVVWVVGLVALWRRPAWRPLRGLVVAYPVLLAFTFAAGAQVYYASGLVTAFLAAGAVVVAQWARTTARRVAVVGLVTLNAVGCALIALPLVPVTTLGETPVPDLNQTARDAVGWPDYVRQIEAVHDALPDADRERSVVVTQNYGEAGAVDRFAAHLPVYSGHNALHALGPPPDDATVAVVVGDGVSAWSRSFAACEVADRLDNGVDVDTEEQGVAVMICRDPVGGWDAVWPRLAHLD